MIQKPVEESAETESLTGAYADALGTVFREATLRVQEMHTAIGRQTYDVLRRIPVVSDPARLVQAVDETTTAAVYAAVRQGGEVAAGVGKWLVAYRERQGIQDGPDNTQTPTRAGGPVPENVRAALNGIVGDYFATTGSPLAIKMAFRKDGRDIAMTPQGLADALPPESDRFCIFLHGLCGDEDNWSLYADTAWPEQPGQQYAPLVEEEFGYTPLHVRYNSGLALAENSRLLAAMLETFVASAPRPVREVVLVGHSMGGLISRGACLAADVEGHTWLSTVRSVICLGSPQQGAPLARLGRLATAALGFLNVTKPFHKIAEVRSIGIKDLCHGLVNDGDCEPSPTLMAIPLRFVGATLVADPEHFLGQWFGDGMVTPGSATLSGLDGEDGDIDAVTVGGIGHMGLLNHPRVYEAIRTWLHELSSSPQGEENLQPNVPTGI